MKPSVLFVLPATSLHGGNRVVFELAEGLADRGYPVEVVSPEPAPAWHAVRVPYRQLPVFEPGALPRAEIAIGTFWPTVRPVVESGAPHPFHFCQGFEGVHREYAPILDQIDATYQLPVPKIMVSQHLVPVIRERYGSRCHLIGQFVDHQLFTPADPSAAAVAHRPLQIGVVGPFGIRSKGIPELLAGLRLAKEAGLALEVHHASADAISEDERGLGMTDHYYHHLPTHEMPAFYHRLDSYIHSSYDEEGFPLPPLEAMACGVPVALTSIRSFEVLPEDAVLRYPPGQPEAVVPVIRELAQPERRQQLRRAGLDTAAQYTLAAVLDRLEEAFRQEGVDV